MGSFLIISSLMNPATPAINGIVIPATASKAMAWMNHFGESGLSSIYLNPLVDTSAFFLTGLLTEAGTDSSLNILPSTQIVNA